LLQIQPDHRAIHSFPTRRSSDLETIHGQDHDSFAPVLKETVETLRSDRVPFALIGGIAVSSFGRPRWTHDIDLLIRLHDADRARSEEHTSELQSRENLVVRLLLE